MRGCLPSLDVIPLPLLDGDMLFHAVRAKYPSAGGYLKAFPVTWSNVLADVLNLVEETGRWPDDFLFAYIVIIPTSEGDATPLGQRPLSVLTTGSIQTLGNCSD